MILVTLPEELPVSETIESAYTLEDKAGVQLGPVIVNACDPEPVGLARPAADVAAAGGVTVDADHLDALEQARRFRLAPPRRLRRAGRAPPARTCPCPRCSCPALEADAIGPGETRAALADAPWPSAVGARSSARGPGHVTTTTLPELVAERSVIVCCGSGGVGKTTVSATFALAAARAGRRCLRGHRRPGPAAGRRPGRAVAAQHALRGGRATGPATSTR